LEERRVGLEQEFFLVEHSGALSNRADEFLARCTELARETGADPECFAPECARCMVEINAPPAPSAEGLSGEYLASVGLALEAARSLGLRLYPFATYPLAEECSLRDEPRYEIQARTLGRERFRIAGRCAGVHLHLEAAPRSVDPATAVSYDSTRAAREELLALYNLATALDPALVVLSRSGPFYGGKATGLANRTACYRGDPDLFPNGLYAGLAAAGGLRPYAGSVGELVALQFARHHAWLAAVEGAGLDPALLSETGDGLLQTSWNPVRLNAVGTVELRSPDSNLPETVLALANLVERAAGRVRREGLRVVPRAGLAVFEADEEALYVPGFDYLGGRLFREAVSAGAESPEVVAYLDSVLAFSGADAAAFKDAEGRYRSAEAEVLEQFPAGTVLSREEGFALVRDACDELEAQVSALGAAPAEPAKAGEA
jgi:hypothetical protein